MNRSGATLIMSSLILTGCAMTALTSEGTMVRKVSPSWSMKCEFLGVVSAHEYMGFNKANNKVSALNDIRNQVAALGGNAYAISESASEKYSVNVQADAYRCPVHKMKSET